MKAVRWVWAQRHWEAAVQVAVREAGLAGIAQDVRRHKVAGGLVARLRKAQNAYGRLRITHAQYRLLHEALGTEGAEGELREIFDEASRVSDAGLPHRERQKNAERLLDALDERRSVASEVSS